MREKVLTTVVTFGTTTQAIAMERECKKTGFEGTTRQNRLPQANYG